MSSYQKAMWKAYHSSMFRKNSLVEMMRWLEGTAEEEIKEEQERLTELLIHVSAEKNNIVYPMKLDRLEYSGYGVSLEDSYVYKFDSHVSRWKRIGICNSNDIGKPYEIEVHSNGYFKRCKLHECVAWTCTEELPKHPSLTEEEWDECSESVKRVLQKELEIYFIDGNHYNFRKDNLGWIYR